MRSKKAGWLRVMSHLIDSRVSIIVPVYNTSIEYLRECTASVEAQTYSDIELIIVDDGSTDAAWGAAVRCDAVLRQFSFESRHECEFQRLHLVILKTFLGTAVHGLFAVE